MRNKRKTRKKFTPTNHTDTPELSQEETARLAKALEDEKFRKLLFDYANEISDPKVREENEKYLQQLEREASGPKDRKLMTPKAGFCLIYKKKSSRLKFYINICSGDLVDDPFLGFVNERSPHETGEIEQDACCKKSGIHWQIPYILGHSRVERFDGKNCEVIDIAFSPKALELEKSDPTFRKILIQTAVDSLDQNLNIKLSGEGELYHLASLGKPSLMSVKFKEKKTIELKQTKPTANIILEPKYTVVEKGAHELSNFFGNRKDVFVDNRPRQLVYKVHLPKVKNISQVDLNIEDDQILTISVPTIYELNLTVHYPIDADSCGAQWFSKEKTLQLTVDVLPLSREEIQTIMKKLKKTAPPEQPAPEPIEKEVEKKTEAPKEAVGCLEVPDEKIEDFEVILPTAEVKAGLIEVVEEPEESVQKAEEKENEAEEKTVDSEEANKEKDTNDYIEDVKTAIENIHLDNAFLLELE